MRSIAGRLRFQPSRSAPSLPHQAPAERGENTGIPKASKPRKSLRLDPLENNIRRFETSLKRLKCAKSGRFLTAWRTRPFDPKRKFLGCEPIGRLNARRPLPRPPAARLSVPRRPPSGSIALATASALTSTARFMARCTPASPW